MGELVGIDLGTTNSCVAIYREGRAEILPADNGDRTIPSVVARSATGDWLVGVAAKRQSVTNPTNTLYATKRLLGRKWDSQVVQDLRRVAPFEIVKADNGDAWVRLAGVAMSPQEVAARILRELKASAEHQLGKPVTDAVMTVPAYFDDAQRQATKDAGTIAGLQVAAILNEPTAAALAYGPPRSGSKVAVFDLGGGTFDISIVNVEQGVYEVLATSGDTFLGGEDFDRVLLQELLERCRTEHRTDVANNATALQRLKEAVEKCKAELTAVSQSNYMLPFLADGPDGAVNLSGILRRDWFERACSPLLQRLAPPCELALADAGLRADQIDQVVLVGGQTRMPAIDACVQKLFGRAPARDVNPDEVVALGAATQGGVIAGALQEVVLLDVTPHSLGIDVHHGKMSVIVPRNTTIPTTATRKYKTLKDNQRRVQVDVYQGEQTTTADNRLLGRFAMTELPARPAGEVQVEVTFEVDSDGIVRVSAQDLSTGRATAMSIEGGAGLSRERVEQLTVASGVTKPAAASSAVRMNAITRQIESVTFDPLDAEPPPMPHSHTASPHATTTKIPVVPPPTRPRAKPTTGDSFFPDPAREAQEQQDAVGEFSETPTALGVGVKVPLPPRTGSSAEQSPGQARRTRRRSSAGYGFVSERTRRITDVYNSHMRVRQTTERRSAVPPPERRNPVHEEYEHLRKADLFAQLGVHWTDCPEVVAGALDRLEQSHGPGSPKARLSEQYAALRLELARKAAEQLDTVAKRRAYRADVLSVDVRHAAELLTQQARLEARRGELASAKQKLRAALDLEPDSDRKQLLRQLTSG